MSNSNSSTYENDIKELLDAYNASKVRDGILSILKGVKSGSYSDIRIVENFELLKIYVIGTRPSKAHITRSNLLGFVNESLFALPGEKLSDKIVQERISYILSKVVGTDASFSRTMDVAQQILNGEFSEDFKGRNKDLFLDEEKYRNIYNRLEGLTNTTKKHITEILMVLGFNLDVLRAYIQDSGVPPRTHFKTKEFNQESKSNRTKKNISWIGVSLFFLLALLISIWTLNYQPVESIGEDGRMRVSGDDVFGLGRKVDPTTETKNDILLMTDTLLHESYIGTNPSTSSGDVWIKLWLINTSRDYAAYAHSIAVKSMNPIVKAGEIESDRFKIYPAKGAIEVRLDCSAQTVYEWIVEQEKPTLEPLEKKPFWLHISGHGDCILPFKVYVRVQSNSVRQIIAADTSYLLALN